MSAPTLTFDCQACGACCATFRVSFHWSEADDAPGGTVPLGLTEPVGLHLRCMQGTSVRPVRCTALTGELGQHVGCSIYPLRSSTCRSVEPGDAQCLKARAHHGLPVQA
ncbi:MAG: hypothetical protein RLZZ182_2549 [Pseudomonadota bacterium]|jgi:Fe-S-cluster containining protein